MTAALETIGLKKNFGGARRDARSLAADRARRAPRADRPERRRQDHRHQSPDRRAEPNGGSVSCSKARTSPTCPCMRGRCAACRAPSRSTSCSPICRRSRRSRSRCRERRGQGGGWWRRLGRPRPTTTPRSTEHVVALSPARCHERAHRDLALRQAAAARDRAGDRGEAARAAARRAGRRRARGRAPGHSRRGRGAAARGLGAADRARHGSRVFVRRSHLGAGQRRAAGGGRAGARSRAIRASRRCISARAPMPDWLTHRGPARRLWRGHRDARA